MILLTACIISSSNTFASNSPNPGFVGKSIKRHEEEELDEQPHEIRIKSMQCVSRAINSNFACI